MYLDMILTGHSFLCLNEVMREMAAFPIGWVFQKSRQALDLRRLVAWESVYVVFFFEE